MQTKGRYTHVNLRTSSVRRLQRPTSVIKSGIKVVRPHDVQGVHCCWICAAVVRCYVQVTVASGYDGTLSQYGQLDAVNGKQSDGTKEPSKNAHWNQKDQNHHQME